MAKISDAPLDWKEFIILKWFKERFGFKTVKQIDRYSDLETRFRKYKYNNDTKEIEKAYAPH